MTFLRKTCVYPVVRGANGPSNHAARTVGALRRVNPQAQFAMYENPNTETALLDFLTWDPQGGDHVEFNRKMRSEIVPALAHFPLYRQ